MRAGAGVGAVPTGWCAVTYPCQAASVALMRADVVGLLCGRGLERLAVDAEMCVGELAANAVRHRPPRRRGGRIELSVAAVDAGRRLWLAVHDPWPGRPCPRQAGEDDEAGRGLALVASLAADWGCVPDDGPGVPGSVGKTVWCELLLRAGADG